MHLAIVTPYPPMITGVGQYGYHVSNGLARSGKYDRITILTGQAPGEHIAARRPELQVERAWEAHSLWAGMQIARRLRQLQPDVVWYNLSASGFGASPLVNLSGLFSPLLGRLAGLPGVVTLHEMVEGADLRALRAPGGRLAALGARSLSRLAAQGEVVCVTLRRNIELFAAQGHAGFVGRRPRVVHIPHCSYEPAEFLAESGHLEILLFSSMAPFKGIDLLLEAYRALRLRLPGLALTIAGAPHPRFPGYPQQVRQAFSDLTSVRWLEGVPEAELKDLFARATMLALPYTATTGSSSVLYRAATWGRAVVASDLPELRASAEEAGLRLAYFRSGDAVHLAKALERLLTVPQERRGLAQHNFQVAERLTLEETCRLYQHTFDLARSVHASRLGRAAPLPTHQEAP